MPAYKPVDHRLTDRIPEPPPPPMRCAFLGVPVVCALDGLLWIEQWRGTLQGANADRATTEKVTRPATQPPAAPASQE
ncbi:hypothetical protein [Frateuria sp. YIM B11624]|uniref:hypothetical protein n=1 Tax=Frateuria sp. YIM B11624 TaxID=3143185 RepID=UPI003C7858BC